MSKTKVPDGVTTHSPTAGATEGSLAPGPAAFQVRPAQPHDLPFCAQRDFSIKDESELRRKMAAGELILATQSEVPVAYLRWEKLWGKIPYMSVINVVDEFQGQGAGTQMLHFLESLVRPAPLLLTSAESDAPHALRWHQKHGFQECGFIDGLNPGGIREIFLSKSLAP